MKPDPRFTKLARLLVEYSVEIKEKEKAIITGTTASEPLLRELFQEVLRVGAYPRVNILFQDQEYLFYSNANDDQMSYSDPFLLYEVENSDAIIGIFPNLNPHALTSIDPQKKQRHALAQNPITETVFRRWGEGKLRWVGTACPSPAMAQEAHMSFEEYAEFLFDCMHLNEENPTDFWIEFSKWQQKICDRLNGVKEVRYVGQDTDLQFNCDGRTWINCDGKNNFPDGEVFTGPVENSVEGKMRFTYPGIYQGEEIQDIRLRFEKGKVVEASAVKGEKLLKTILETDEGARYVGEIAIGTNDNINRFTKNILLDEKMGGTVHLAIGRGIPQSGSLNKSAVHWDMLKNMREGGQIFADGQLIYNDGVFLL